MAIDCSVETASTGRIALVRYGDTHNYVPVVTILCAGEANKKAMTSSSVVAA